MVAGPKGRPLSRLRSSVAPVSASVAWACYHYVNIYERVSDEH